MQRPQIPGSNLKGLSPQLWANMPLEAMLAGDRSVGIALFDDFNAFGPCGAISSTTGWFQSNGISYLAYIDGDAGVMATPGINIAVPSTTPSVDANGPGVIMLSPDNDDNDDVVIQAGGGVQMPFNLISASAGDLVFEARWKYSSIAGGTDFFLGLGGTGAAANNGVRADNSGALASNNFIGFTRLATGTSSLTFTYQRASGTEATHTGMATLVADTYVKTGFRYNQARHTCEVYVNDVKVHTVTNAETGATPWPTLWMNFISHVKYQSTAMDDLYIDWWACAQRS